MRRFWDSGQDGKSVKESGRSGIDSTSAPGWAGCTPSTQRPRQPEPPSRDDCQNEVRLPHLNLLGEAGAYRRDDPSPSRSGARNPVFA